MTANLGLVFLGGGLGAACRFLAAQATIHLTKLPTIWSTLFVNVAGSFLIGILAARSPKESAWLFLAVGLLGGFTTFSSFSLDCVEQIRAGQIVPAMIYAAGTCLLCVGACAAGVHFFSATR